MFSGCHSNGKPRLRFGCLPAPTPRTRWPDPNNLGPHCYNYNPLEKGGILYTCKAGHIDLTHVRTVADTTRYLVMKTHETLMKNDIEFSFKFHLDRSRHIVRLTYPETWEGLPQKKKEQIANDISLNLGQYLAYTASGWHEILTWFGYHSMFLMPEFNSAFSWEDVFSNLLGVRLAVEALEDTEHTYDRAMTLAINRELQTLGVQSGHTAKLAAEKMKGKWFSGYLMVDMKKRNLDVGLDDGYVTPTIVPSLPQCAETKPQTYPAPNLDVLSKYGFSMQYEIIPKESGKSKILKIVYPGVERKKWIEPTIHLATIMDYITKHAVEKYGFDIAVPYEPNNKQKE